MNQLKSLGSGIHIFSRMIAASVAGVTQLRHDQGLATNSLLGGIWSDTYRVRSGSVLLDSSIECSGLSSPNIRDILGRAAIASIALEDTLSFNRHHRDAKLLNPDGVIPGMNGVALMSPKSADVWQSRYGSKEQPEYQVDRSIMFSEVASPIGSLEDINHWRRSMIEVMIRLETNIHLCKYIVHLSSTRVQI